MKNKKKGTSSKTWAIDCRIDGAFDFAMKILEESTKEDKYPLDLRINFIKIAYSNSLETMAKVQSDTKRYKLNTGFKLFTRNLSKISQNCIKLLSSINDKTVLNLPNKENLYEFPVITNPYDFIDIDYKGINQEIEDAYNLGINIPNLRLKGYANEYSYPKIYQKIKDPKDESTSIEVKLMPTNDVVVYLPEIIASILYYQSDFDSLYPNEQRRINNDYLDYIRDSCNIVDTPRPLLVHVPYDSFSNIIDILSCAASNPDKEIKEIYITLYRMGSYSKIIDIISEATKSNIHCKVYIELSARGETFKDLDYLTRLINSSNKEYLDVKIHYNGIKVHGKMMYIGFADPAKPDIGIFSTGNYNETTARVYKDYHYVSCEPDVTSMIKRNFEVLWNSEQPVLNSISNILAKEIYTEISKGSNGRIWIQTNHLDNKYIVNLLKEANKRGCDEKLIVRTTKGFHNKEFKNCKTVIGKYLEHARVYIFGSGKDRRVYLSSSDVLFRNLYNRFEAYVKISDTYTQNVLISDFNDLYKNGQKF